MRGRDHDAGVAAQMPHGEGEQGGGAVVGEEVHAEPGRGHHPRTQLGELGRVMARVPGDRATPRRLRPFPGRHVIGQAPRALRDRPLVEDVRTDRVHLAATATRAELEHPEEGVVELGPPIVLDVLQEPRAISGERRLGQPSPYVCRRRIGEPAGRLRPGDPTRRLFRTDHSSLSFDTSMSRRPQSAAYPDTPGGASRARFEPARHGSLVGPRRPASDDATHDFNERFDGVGPHRPLVTTPFL